MGIACAMAFSARGCNEQLKSTVGIQHRVAFNGVFKFLAVNHVGG